MHSIDDQIRCVRREIEMRERVYPPRVESGRMNEFQARRQIGLMKSVLRTLMAVAMEAQPKVSRGR